MSTEENHPNDEESIFSAKKSTLYIELHNFSFQHNNFQNEDADKFIGRKSIRNRLRSILGQREIRSGVYLITGNRGVGKTSLVNKVLDEVSKKIKISTKLQSFFILFCCTMLLTIFLKSFNGYEYTMTGIILSILIFLASHYLYHFSLLRKEKIYRNQFKHPFFIIMLELLTENPHSYQTGKLFSIIKTANWAFIIQLASCLFRLCPDHKDQNWLVSPPGICMFVIFLLWETHVISLVIQSYLIKPDSPDNKELKNLIKQDKIIFYSITPIILSSFILIITVIIFIIQRIYDFTTTGPIITIGSFQIAILASSMYSIFQSPIIKERKSSQYLNGKRGEDLWKKLSHYAIKTVKLLAERFSKLITLNNNINKPRQIYVKINLGYEELNSLDVLRLIAHHIKIEYQKYIYTGKFYWQRTTALTIICAFGAWYFSHYLEISLNSLFETCSHSTFHIVTDTINYMLCILEEIYNSFKLGVEYLTGFLYIPFDNAKNNLSELEKIQIGVSFNHVLLFFILVLIYKLTAYIPIINKVRAPYLNYRHLKKLQDSIAASIKMEEGIKTGSRAFSFNRKKEVNYPIMDTHDIEKSLIDIMTDISEGWMFQVPQFIIIFDELDKIESEDIKKAKMSKTDSFSPDTIRLRQEAMFNLLSSLKYILSTMPAKFLFVAGREMYEASLADASDRSRYLSSIFDEVINVPSFLSDTPNNKRHDVCSRTEEYVCRLLFPPHEIVKEYSIKEYGNYLKRQMQHNPEKYLHIDSLINEIQLHLQNFVTYLTYAGKGAPKKIINLMESFIVKISPEKIESIKKHSGNYMENQPKFIKIYSNTLYFLKFDFYQQYTIGLMSRMITPILYRFSNRNIHQYGDKLLVSTLFFIDHLYKFHNHSFSWRALTSTPELIDVHKTPDLRNYITDILHYLSQNDLKVISNGLYDFRFYKVIAQEVGFLTKVSEYSSAIFNFSLDESLAVKQYYLRKLIEQRKIYESDKVETRNSISQLVNLHFTLGELYMYDEELDSAIAEFDAAIAIIQTLHPEEMTQSIIFTLIRNMLSLGITYEKQHLNEEAFLIYNRVVELIIASRNTNIENLGLKTFQDDKDDKKMKVRYVPDKNEDEQKEPGVYFTSEKDRSYNLMELLDKIPHQHPQIHAVISKISGYESLQLFYLPLLAKLQILEKVQTGGIQPNDIKRTLKEFYFLINMVNKENRRLICASFYLRLGNILYYKNSVIFKGKDFDDEDIWPFAITKQSPWCQNCTEDLYDENDEEHPAKPFKCIFIKNDAYKFYLHSLFLTLKGTNYIKCPSINALFLHLQDIKDNDYNGWDEGKFNILAKTFSNIGDSILSETDEDMISSEEKKEFVAFLSEYFKERNKTDSGKENEETDEKRNSSNALEVLSKIYKQTNNKLIIITKFYMLAILYFRKATAYNLTEYTYLKILTLLKYNTFPGIAPEETLLETGKELLNKTIRNTSSAFKDVCFENRQDLENILGSNEQNMKSLMQRTFIFSENAEAILAFKGIQLAGMTESEENTEENTKKNTYIQKIEAFYKDTFQNIHYEVFNNMYNRIKLLKFKTEVNYRWLRALLHQSNPKISLRLDNESFYQSGLKKLMEELNAPENFTFEDSAKKKIILLISDSLFNLTEILKFVQIYGETFLLTNLFVADTYDKMTSWLQIKEYMRKKDIWKETDDEHLKQLINERYFDKLQICENAANTTRFYYKAEEEHHEGRTYKDMINRACFLNDEFSDQRLHFIMAQERKKVTSQNFKKNTRNIKNNEGETFYRDILKDL